MYTLGKIEKRRKTKEKYIGKKVDGVPEKNFM